MIEIEPGNRVPFVPQHLFKIFGDGQFTNRVSVDIALVASGESYARGNEHNRHGAVNGLAMRLPMTCWDIPAVLKSGTAEPTSAAAAPVSTSTGKTSGRPTPT